MSLPRIPGFVNTELRFYLLFIYSMHRHLFIFQLHKFKYNVKKGFSLFKNVRLFMGSREFMRIFCKNKHFFDAPCDN